jgi:hypothetical protein
MNDDLWGLFQQFLRKRFILDNQFGQSSPTLDFIALSLIVLNQCLLMFQFFSKFNFLLNLFFFEVGQGSSIHLSPFEIVLLINLSFRKQ